MDRNQSERRGGIITRHTLVQWRRMGTMMQNHTRGEVINERGFSGGRRGLSVLLTADINQMMIAEGNTIPENNQRKTRFEFTVDAGVRKLIKTQIGKDAIPLCCFPIWSGAITDTERQTASRHQDFSCDISVGYMETRQNTRKVKEQYKSTGEDQKHKGKGPMKEDHPQEIWEVEDDSEEELPRGEERKWPFTQDRLIDDDQQQTDTEHQTAQEGKVRQYGTRKCGRGTGSDADLSRRSGRGQRRSTREEGRNFRQEANPVKKARRTVN